MVRRNLFQPPAPPSETTATPDARFPATGAMSGVRSTLKELSNNAVREIDPALIDDGGPSDRLAFGAAEVASLAESIRTHGQQVPIMVRALSDAPGRFRIVYGRRRLQALRQLGLKAKALVRSLTDEEAILAQGQENNLRLDPSFIEKALFVQDLAEAGYGPDIIRDALSVDKPMLSRMTKIARLVPRDVIHQIGPAHGVGRRRWEVLADAAQARGLNLVSLAGELDLESVPDSDARFARLEDAATRTQSAPPAPSLTVQVDGRRFAELKPTARALTIKMVRADAPGFTEWLEENAEDALCDLYQSWRTKAD